MTGPTLDGVERIDAALGEIYCLTYVKGIDAAEALRRLGAAKGTIGPRTLDDAVARAPETHDEGLPKIAVAVTLGGWTALVEPDGWEGVRPEALRELSRGTEAVAVMRHDYAEHTFGFAVDGVLLTSFNPEYPGERFGGEPDRLVDLMREVGLDPDEPDEDEDLDGPDVVDSLWLASRISGVALSPEDLDGPLVSAEIWPLLDTPPIEDGYGWTRLSEGLPKLAAAVDAADDETRRAIVLAEARRLCAIAGVGDVPIVVDTLARGERGEYGPVPSDSDLGWTIREWARQFDAAGRRTDPPSQQERQTAEARVKAGKPLRAVLLPDSRSAAHLALEPLVRRSGKRLDTIMSVLQGRLPIGAL